ncbi:acyl-CoA thioesterase 2 isoform X1 [Tanacetum coccineum]
MTSSDHRLWEPVSISASVDVLPSSSPITCSDHRLRSLGYTEILINILSFPNIKLMHWNLNQSCELNSRNILLSMEDLRERRLTNPRLPSTYRNKVATAKFIPWPIEIRFCEPSNSTNYDKRPASDTYVAYCFIALDRYLKVCHTAGDCIVGASCPHYVEISFHGSANSIKVIKEALNEFNKTSGLHPNMSKSTIFFGNMNNIEKYNLIEILPFRTGVIMKYLGVPLITKRNAARWENNMIVADMIQDGRWQWPNGCSQIFPELLNIDVPVLQECVKDKILWKIQNGKLFIFSAKTTWEDLRCRGQNVKWNNMRKGMQDYYHIKKKNVKGLIKEIDENMKIQLKNIKTFCDPSLRMMRFWDVYFVPSSENGSYTNVPCALAERKLFVIYKIFHRVFGRIWKNSLNGDAFLISRAMLKESVAASTDASEIILQWGTVAVLKVQSSLCPICNLAFVKIHRHRFPFPVRGFSYSRLYVNGGNILGAPFLITFWWVVVDVEVEVVNERYVKTKAGAAEVAVAEAVVEDDNAVLAVVVDNAMVVVIDDIVVSFDLHLVSVLVNDS